MTCKYVPFEDAEEYECAERLERYFGEMKEELGLHTVCQMEQSEHLQ